MGDEISQYLRKSEEERRDRLFNGALLLLGFVVAVVSIYYFLRSYGFYLLVICVAAAALSGLLYVANLCNPPYEIHLAEMKEAWKNKLKSDGCWDISTWYILKGATESGFWDGMAYTSYGVFSIVRGPRLTDTDDIPWKLKPKTYRYTVGLFNNVFVDIGPLSWDPKTGDSKKKK